MIPPSPRARFFVARPGNPTLAVPDVTDARAPLTVVDEAYQPLCASVAPTVPTPHRAVLRSLPKLFALPGLRLGYLVAPRPVAQAVQAMLPPWNVSQPAIAAGIAALAEPHEPVRAAVAALQRTARGAPVDDRPHAARRRRQLRPRRRR